MMTLLLYLVLYIEFHRDIADRGENLQNDSMICSQQKFLSVKKIVYNDF